MPDPVSLSTIRQWEGSQHRAFEELAFQLLSEDAPPNTKPIRTGNPDGGVEWYATLPDGKEWGWQAKYITSFKSLQTGLEKSVKTVVAERPDLTKLTFVISINLSAGKAQGARKSDRQKYEELILGWKAKIPETGAIEFDLVQESDLLKRLTRAEHRGRRWFWWNETVLDHHWLLEFQKDQEAVAGDRYRPQLHVDLSLQKDIEGLGLASHFDSEFADFEYQLAKSSPYLHPVDCQNFPELTSTLLPLNAMIEGFKEMISDSQPFTASLEQLKHIRNSATNCVSQLRQASSEVRRIRDSIKISGNPGVMTSNDETRSLDTILHSLRRAEQDIKGVEDWLNGSPVQAAEQGLYFLIGPAGSGKTHFLLDCARTALNQLRPAIVLYGDKFEGDLWASICSQLGIESLGREQLLGVLDAAATASAGKRLVILIDALNETEKPLYWQVNLPLLRAALRRYANISLAVSCRDTYLDATTTEHERRHFVIETHPGFAGEEVEATHRYFNHYGLPAPKIPLLLPEFGIPLFLRLYCESLQASDPSALGVGHEGRINIFERYLNQKTRIIGKRIYPDANSPTNASYHEARIRAALDSVITVLADSTSAWISWDSARVAISTALGCTSEEALRILGDYEHEGVLSQEPAYLRSHTSGLEVRVTFQAFSDFLILKQRFSKSPEPLKDTELKRWLSSHAPWGIQEVASIFLPEKFGIELPDFLELDHTKLDDRRQNYDLQHIYQIFMKTLPYRISLSITDDTIKHLNIALSMERGGTELFSILFAMAPYENNRLNAYGMFRYLQRFSMPNRDAYFGKSTFWVLDDPSSSATRLARWAALGPYPDYPNSVIELSATALSWLLSSANRSMRDWTTKALVQLLHGHLDVMNSLLDRFWSVNDPYIVQRIVLIAYGSLMRGGVSDKPKAAALVQNVRDKITEKPMKMDELLLDAGKGIVDWGIASGLVPADAHQTLRRPHGFPKLGNPLRVDSIEKKLETGYRVSPSKTYDTIFSSVLGHGDFGRYVIESELDRFTRLARGDAHPPKPSSEPYLNKDAVYRFEQSLSSEQTQILSDHIASNGQTELSRLLYPGDESSPLKLTSEQVDILNSCWVYPPRPKNVNFPTELAKRWLFLRTISLGWRPELFGEDDHYRGTRDYGRGDHKVERWGKKYQWIAFHELMARVADNYQQRPDWGEDPHWDPDVRLDSLRDIDPSLPPIDYQDLSGRNEKAVSWKTDSAGLPNNATFSIDFAPYRSDIMQFIESRRCEPLAIDVAIHQDAKGYDWIALHSYESVRESIGDKREWGLTQLTFLHSWFISAEGASQGAENLIRVLVANPGSFNTPSHERGTYFGEFHWMNRRDSGMTEAWRPIGRDDGPNISIIDTCEDYLWESSGLDCSIDGPAFAYVPSRYIFAHRALTTSMDGPSWNDENGIPVFANTRESETEYNPAHRFWVRRSWLQDFLQQEKLALEVATSFERLSHLLVRTTNDHREITLSAALLTADGKFRQVGTPIRRPWPLHT